MARVNEKYAGIAIDVHGPWNYIPGVCVSVCARLCSSSGHSAMARVANTSVFMSAVQHRKCTVELSSLCPAPVLICAGTTSASLARQLYVKNLDRMGWLLFPVPDRDVARAVRVWDPAQLDALANAVHAVACDTLGVACADLDQHY